MSKIKTFRGLIVDGTQDTIVLHTNDGSTGYKIHKFEIFPYQPGDASYESTVQIWKELQATPSASAVTVDFSDNRLLAAAYYGQYSTISSAQQAMAVIFDNEIFNQDIYITHTNVEGGSAAGPVNYYIELEQMSLDLNESTVATLKDIRNSSRPD